MKYWKQICGVSIVMMLVTAGSLFLVSDREGVGTDTEDENTQEEDLRITQSYQVSLMAIQKELYERLHSFAQVLYQYDTAERKFYEGAAEFMTQQAYRELYPASAKEEDGQSAIRVRSTLLKANIYAFYESKAEADVILESHFSLSQGTNGSLTQYLRLALVRQEGQWLITECQIIDTLEG